jgi:Domain of unknown function (DUF4870)
METTAATPSESEKSLSALMHIGPILPLGVFVTAIVIGVQGSKSQFVMRHGRQALCWQLVQIAVTAVLTAIYLPFYMRSMFLMLPTGTESGPSPYDFSGFQQLFAVQMTFMCGVMLVLSGFLAAGLWQAFKALRGQPPAYPVIGRLIDRVFGSPL